MAWSPPALKRRHCGFQSPGDYATFNSNHTPDGTKWQIDITRDTSQDAEVVVEAETAEEAKQIFLHDMDRDLIQWRESDWLGDTDIVEVLPARDDAELTSVDADRLKPTPDDGEIRKEFADIAGRIHRILDDNEAGKSRVVLDPEDVVRLHGIADRLGAVASVRTPTAQ